MDTRILSVDFVCVDHINMFVRNLEESIDFYQRVFGTDGEIKDSGERKGIRWVIIGVPNKFYFCLYEWPHPETIYETDALHINHIGFYVQDFDETVRRIEQLNVQVQYRAQPISWHNRNGISRSLYIEDPNGYKIEFSEKLGGGLDLPA